jgi:hypothetical protein
LTDSIKAKAAELNYDALAIYNWVRNNVEWLPTWGAIQSADHTLGSLKGNSMDISSLLIALYRASGIPARYVHGTLDVPMDQFMNWAGGFTNAEAALRFASSGGIPTEGVLTGGKLVTARMEHIWVEAAIDFEPSRGAKNKSADAWIAMDPSYKQYQFKTGIDVATVTTVNLQTVADNYLASGSVNEQEGWISGFDPAILQSAQTQMQTDLQTYLSNQTTPPTVSDVIGGHNAIIQTFKGFPASLPNHVVVKGTTMDKLPSSLQHRITIQLGTVNDLFPQGKVTLPFAKVNNEKVTLSFKPATQEDEQVLLSLLPEGEITDVSQLPSSIPGYLIQVVPELKVNGQVKATGQAQTLGSDFWLSVTQHFTNRSPKTSSAVYPSGSYYSLSTIGGSVSVTKLQQLQASVANTKTILESGDANLIKTLTGDTLLGDMFYAGTLGYYAQHLAYTHLIAQPQGGHLSLFPSAGTYGYTPKVQFMFGLPMNLTPGGIQMDLFQENVTTQMNDGNLDRRFQFLLQTGVMGSALEHAIPEQMFNDPNDPTNSTEAISAVKALQKAAEAGQRIYQITNTNKATTLPNIHHDAGTMSDINNALNAGKIVITHTDSVSVPGWTGSGYIILDPTVGDGAYKIGGGMNGAFKRLLDSASKTLDKALFWLGSFQSLLKNPALKLALRGVISTIAVLLLTFKNLISIVKECDYVPMIAILLTAFLITDIILKVTLLTTSFAVSLLASVTFGYFENKALETLKNVTCAK